MVKPLRSLLDGLGEHPVLAVDTAPIIYWFEGHPRLADRFGAESLRVSLFLLSVLTIFGGLLFWRASVHYPHDLTRVGRTDEGISPLGQGKLTESTL